MKIQTTQRGFQFVEFEDHNGQRCTLQQSSLALFEQPGMGAIWFGTGENRMHINLEQLKELIPHLEAWQENGDFTLKDHGLAAEECSTCKHWDKDGAEGDTSGVCTRLSQPNTAQDDRSAAKIAADAWKPEERQEGFVETFRIATWSDFHCSLFEPAAEAEAEAA